MSSDPKKDRRLPDMFGNERDLPTGYHLEKTTDGYRVVISPRKSRVVRQIFSLAANGVSLDEIAARLNASGD